MSMGKTGILSSFSVGTEIKISYGSHPMGPGVASPGEAYSGSRKSAQRHAYPVHSAAGFVELAPSSFRAASWNDRFVAAKEFYNALAKVPGVAKVSDLHWMHSDLHVVLHFNFLSGAGFDLHCDWHLALHFDFHWDLPGAASSMFFRRV